MKKVLDVGCGHGFFTSCLSAKNDVVGIDISDPDIKIARKRYPHVNFQLMSAEKLIFPDDYFEEVYAMDILEHVDNLDMVLREISRVLKTDGKFIINIPYWKSEEWLGKIRPSYFEEIHHVRVFKDSELDSILAKYNMRILSKKKSGFLSHIEHYYMFTRKINSKTQLGIGNWRDNWKTKFFHLSLLLFDDEVLRTPLKFFPLWIITVPIGFLINLCGNRYFPKSISYEVIKEK
ncbi:MAG: class I SAM-dependent methyltransferase [bacterium]|nr:class I SAM-dependent methyltransferase [bacterium]